MKKQWETYEEWYRATRKSNKGSEFKIRNCWGIYQAYKHIRKNGWYDIGRPLKQHEFYSVIRSINNLLSKEIANGSVVTFPHKMGRLELQKYYVKVWIDDKGKLHNTYPVNWYDTLKLWYEDEEARIKKILVRNEYPWIYHVKYRKKRATYENKQFYQFCLNTFIKRELRKNIKQGKVDTMYGK